MIIRTAIVLSAVLLGGCISLGPKTPASLLTLTPAIAPAVNATRVASVGNTLLINALSAPQAIATTRVPVYDGASQLAYVKDAVWNDAPTRLFTRLLSDTISARTDKIVLSLRQANLDPGSQLSGQLQNFGIDPATLQAVVTFDATITRGGGQIETRRFEARSPVATIEAVAAGAALNLAANDVATQVADWVR